MKIFDDFCNALGKYLMPEPENKPTEETQKPPVASTPEPVETTDPVASPEPAATPEPMATPEPVKGPEPVAEPEPVVAAPEPVTAPEPPVIDEPVEVAPTPEINPVAEVTPDPQGVENVELPELTPLPEPPALVPDEIPANDIPATNTDTGTPPPPADLDIIPDSPITNGTADTTAKPATPVAPVQPRAPQPTQPQAPQTPKLDMRPAAEQNLDNASKIVKVIESQLGDEPKLAEFVLMMLTDVDIVLARLKSDEFKKTVKSRLSSNFGVLFSDITASKYNAEKHIGAIEIAPHVWAQLVGKSNDDIKNGDTDDEENRRIESFTLTVEPGFGTMVESPVTFTEAGTYNIGRGKTTRLSNGAIRRNPIAITDDDSQLAVSRTHAHIKFMPDKGVFLFVEPSGTSLAGKRTKVFRGNDKGIPLENPQMGFRLHDGDQIELSKQVLINVTITSAK